MSEKTKIDVSEACCIAREFMAFMVGNLSLNSYMIEHAYQIEQGIAVKCSIKPTFKSERISYTFTINSDGVVAAIRLGEKDE